LSNAEEIKKYKDLMDAGAITEEEFERKKEELLHAAEQANDSSATGGMNARTTSILAYITLIGFIIAFCVGDREGAKFHLNQALVIFLFSFLSWIPFIGWLWGILMFIFWILGLIAAINGEEKPVPIIGGIKIIK
jgi:uncharacterized membrane protein